jgi:isoaspartyl peptidase/L-asparaginase-like protein (Ntn-hydrolase superfamily)
VVVSQSFLGESLEKAAESAIEELDQDGGLGGVIAIDNLGNGMCASISRVKFCGGVL